MTRLASPVSGLGGAAALSANVLAVLVFVVVAEIDVERFGLPTQG
jgi:hypothetical protein